MRLRTLGGLELVGSGFRKTKPLLLLAYLAVEGPMARRFLAELFWPSASNPLNSLSKALSQLRDPLGAAIDADDAKAWTTVASDVAEVRARLEADDAERALALYRGPFLHGTSPAHIGAELEEWLYGVREDLAAELRHVLLAQAEREAATAGPEQAAARVETACALPGAPPLEPTELIRAYTLLLAADRPLARTLRAEAEGYGLDLPATRADARAALPARPDPAASPPDRLPRYGGRFVGRELELAELGAMLARDDCRLLTLLGPGGAGKTRLAVQLARGLRQGERFPGGVVYVPLESLDGAASLPRQLAEALGLSGGDDDPLTRVAAHLGERRALLVLDNFEQLLDGAELLSTLLASCRRLKLLVTTRERLRLDEEWLFSLAGLVAPDATDAPGEAGRFDAVRLFLERARRADRRFELDGATTGPVVEICRLVDGSPLAIELAAAWVRTLPLREVVEAIREGLDLLETTMRNVPERQRSIRATLDGSWKRLDPGAREVLAGLSVFEGGFTPGAARVVTGAPITTLAALADASLLELDAAGRYRCHPLLRQYAGEKLAETPEARQRVRRLHARHYLEHLRRCHADLAAGDSRPALAAFDAERANLGAAWLRSVAEAGGGPDDPGDPDPDALHEASYALMEFLFRKGSGQEAIDLFARAETRLVADSPARRRLIGTLCLFQAVFHFYLGRGDATRELVGRSLTLLRPLGETRGVIRGLNLLGGVAKTSGAWEEARDHYREALELAEAAGEMTSSYHNNLGHVARDLGAWDEAEGHYRRALDAAAAGPAIARASPLQNLGSLKVVVGELDAAQPLLDESLRVCLEHGYDAHLPYSLCGLAEAAFARGDLAAAGGRCREAIVQARDQDDRLQEARLRTLLARILTREGDLAAAETASRGALRLARDAGDLPALLDALATRAELVAAQDGTEPAGAIPALLLAHPACRHETRERIRALDADAEPASGDRDALLGRLLIRLGI